jgi:hypothetical protein
MSKAANRPLAVFAGTLPGAEGWLILAAFGRGACVPSIGVA